MFGITVGDLRLLEDEAWSNALFQKICNKENDKQFKISDISDGEIRIDISFREKVEKGEFIDDERATKLHQLLENLDIMSFLYSLPGDFSYTIPKNILVGDELDYGEINSKKKIKLQHFFGIKLEETKIGQMLKTLAPHNDLPKFSSKKQMKEFFFKKYAEILKNTKVQEDKEG